MDNKDKEIMEQVEEKDELNFDFSKVKAKSIYISGKYIFINY